MGECFRIAIVQTGECFARCLLSEYSDYKVVSAVAEVLIRKATEHPYSRPRVILYAGNYGKTNSSKCAYLTYKASYIRWALSAKIHLIVKRGRVALSTSPLALVPVEITTADLKA